MKNNKVAWKPDIMVYPVPTVMVSCGNRQTGYTIIAFAWTGTV